jgi:hypothetical protein
MDRGELRLSRRQVLAAAGGVGAVAVGAGAGTEAFLSDDESFEGNRIVAGDLDLRVAWRASADGPRVVSRRQSEGYPTPRSDATAPVIDLADVKPGDSGRIDFRLRVDGNPGYVSLVGAEAADGEGERPEPERGRLDGALPAGAEGELDELTDVTLSYPDTGVSAYTVSLASLVGLGGLGTGITLDGAGATTVPRAVLGEASPAAFPGDGTRRVRVEWTVPPTLGNGVQGDDYRFALGFYGEQARWNEP